MLDKVFAEENVRPLEIFFFNVFLSPTLVERDASNA